jgi:mannose-1-phosphate guanylyltransferase
VDAVILVGGGGTRLRPLTYAVPKPLIPVLNKPLIGHLISHLRHHGVDRVVLAAAASDTRIEDTIGDGAEYDVPVTYSYETEPLGSGLAVKLAAKDFDGPFFVCNGDVLTDVDLTAMAARHNERSAVMSIFLAPVADPSSYGIADVDATNRITRFVEKPPPGQAPSNLGNAGTWLFDPEVLEHIPDQKMDGSIERLVMPGLIAEGRLVLGFPSDAYWMDLGTPERYMQIHRDLLGGLLPTWLSAESLAGPMLGEACEIWQDASIVAPAVLGRRCRVGGQAHITGPTVLGDDCAVREHATIERSVLWNGVRIGANAIVRDSIIGAGCWIGDDAVVENAVLANGARVQRGVHLAPGARLEPDEVAS